MAGPCLNDTDCISLNLDGGGALEAAPIISPDAGNSLECTANGLFVPGVASAALTTQTNAAVGPLILLFPNLEMTLQTSTFTITNPSGVNACTYLVLANTGMNSFNSIPATCIPRIVTWTTQDAAAYVLRRRCAASNQGAIALLFEFDGATEIFRGTLAAGASTTCKIQKRGTFIGTAGTSVSVGAVYWSGLTFPA